VRKWSLELARGRPRPGEEGWRPLVPAPVVDAVTALGIAALGTVSGLGARHQGEHVPAGAIVVLAAMGLALFPRRRFPGTVLAAVIALSVVLALMNTSLEGDFLAVLVSGYSAAVYGKRPLAVGLGVAGVGVLLVAAIAALAVDNGRLQAPGWARTLLALVGAWLIGLVIRSQFKARSDHLAVLRERAALSAARQEAEARRATIAERLRIARELHDIIAHHLTVVVIQAQGAQRTLKRDPAMASAAMRDVEQTGRTALEEMRRMLGLLRTGELAAGDGGEPAAEDCDRQPGGHGDAHPAADDAERPCTALVPLPGLADIGALAERMRSAGLTVTVRTSGQPRDVPEDVGLTAYRIVQEALTNVLKHAGRAEATVRLNYEAGLDVTITDDGRGAAAHLGASAARVSGAGRGMTGMHERVAAAGGRLTVGPRPGGGFGVHARIPLEDP